MEKVKHTFSFFGVNATMLLKGCTWTWWKKKKIWRISKTFPIVSHHRQFTAIILFCSFYTSSYRMLF